MRARFLALSTLMLFGACEPEGTRPAETVVLAMIDAVNARDFDALDTLVAADVRRYSGATPDVQIRSLDDFKAFLHADLAGVGKIAEIWVEWDNLNILTQLGHFPPGGVMSESAE